ncbi:hypothetical protein C1645_834777 [Glomus cerebriforme]|uniref:Uncharacterized protein n=1 Tax=Glomus cerebriforme TaxID=658196 RepID=A0A397SDM0_9GLOM|nr:hypothetical protein C1645_834777 [Glomus cerebriforme]
MSSYQKTHTLQSDIINIDLFLDSPIISTSQKASSSTSSPSNNTTDNNYTYTITDFEKFDYYMKFNTLPHIIHGSNPRIISDITAIVHSRDTHNKCLSDINHNERSSKLPSNVIDFVHQLATNSQSYNYHNQESFHYTYVIKLISTLTNFQDEVHFIHSGLPINTLSQMISDDCLKTLQEMVIRVLSFKERNDSKEISDNPPMQKNNLREPLQEIDSNNTNLEITMNTNNLVNLIKLV